MLLSLFYKTMLESIMCFALTCWGGNLNSLALDKFNRVIKKCSSLCNPASPFPSIQVTHCCQCQKKINAILKDKSHPFCNLISFSTRSGKPLTFHCRRERYRNSFLPFSIKFLSGNFLFLFHYYLIIAIYVNSCMNVSYSPNNVPQMDNKVFLFLLFLFLFSNFTNH